MVYGCMEGQGSRGVGGERVYGSVDRPEGPGSLGVARAGIGEAFGWMGLCVQLLR